MTIVNRQDDGQNPGLSYENEAPNPSVTPAGVIPDSLLSKEAQKNDEDDQGLDRI
jgi:hypothetical protein